MMRAAIRTVGRRIGLVSRHIITGKNRLDIQLADAGDGAENRTDAADPAAVISDAFHGLGDCIAGCGRGDQQKDIVVPDHRLDIVPEHELAAGIDLRGYHGDTAAGIQCLELAVAEGGGQKRGDNLYAVKADNRLDRRRPGIMGRQLAAGQLGQLMLAFNLGHVNIEIDMRIAGGEMSRCHADADLGVFTGFDFS